MLAGTGAPTFSGFLVALVVVAVFGGLFAWRARTPATAAQTFAATAFGRALDEPLTDYVSAIGHQRATQAAENRRRLLSKDIEKEVGHKAFRSLGEVLDAAAVYAADSGADPAASQKSFWTALNGLDAHLESHGVPGFVGGYSTGAGDTRAVWLLGYFARSRASVRVGDGPPMHVVWGKRLDSLNLTDSAAALDGLSEWTIISLDALEDPAPDAHRRFSLRLQRLIFMLGFARLVWRRYFYPGALAWESRSEPFSDG